jgi:flagellar motor switch/type III secretory pathway protein FliN
MKLDENKIEIEISASLGRAELKLWQFIDLGVGSVIKLNKTAVNTVDIYANGIVIGNGEIWVDNTDNIGIIMVKKF